MDIIGKQLPQGTLKQKQSSFSTIGTSKVYENRDNLKPDILSKLLNFVINMERTLVLSEIAPAAQSVLLSDTNIYMFEVL